MMILFIACFGLGKAARAQLPVGNADKNNVPPTAQQALKAILSNGDVPLTSIPSCKSMGTTFEDRMLLDFLSGVIAFQTEPESQNSLEYTVKSFADEKGKLFWQCDLLLNFRAEAVGDSDITLASNGVKFLMPRGSKKLVRRSLMCTGTG